MKKLFIIASVVAGSLALVGCGQSESEKQAEHKRQMECLDMGYDKHCNVIRDRVRVQPVRAPQFNNIEIEYDYGNVHYGPAMPGSYVNYYGDTRYGYWDIFGNFKFYDPYSTYATNTNSFLLGAGLGGLVAYKMSKTDWTSKNPNGWTSKSRKLEKPRDKNGKVITVAEAKKRAEQSKRDKAAHAKKLKAKKAAKTKELKAKQAKTNAKKAAKKPTVSETAKKKAELKKKLADRQAAKTNGKGNNKLGGQKAAERKIQQKNLSATKTQPRSKKTVSQQKQFKAKSTSSYKSKKQY
ncbi:coil containing protein [Vibrio phage 2.275.O._10N.286.54.E11]|nr:coil containing protein [Vibrio phage 2.275.O._10N.286.54.E11]